MCANTYILHINTNPMINSTLTCSLAIEKVPRNGGFRAADGTFPSFAGKNVTNTYNYVRT